MKELLLVFASVMPFEELLKQMKDSIAEYESDPTEENKRKIEMNAMLIGAKAGVDAEKGGVMDLIKKMDRAEKASKLMNPDELNHTQA